MNILVIGNGFDLAHRLPTKYSDFIMFIKNFKALNGRCKEEIKTRPKFKSLSINIQEYFLQDEVFYEARRNDILKELQLLIDNNIWLEYFMDKVINENKGWIDFESEISEVIKALEYLIEMNKHEVRTNGSDFAENDEVKNSIINKFFAIWNRCNKAKEIGSVGKLDFYGERLRERIEQITSDLNGLIRCLEIYIGEVVERFDIDYRIPEIKNLKIDNLISFNYTNTYQVLYQSDNDKIEYDYLHGKVELKRSIKENNMVLGIDEYLVGNERDEKLDLIEFKKYFQRIYKKTGCKYKAWLESTGEFQAKQAHVLLKRDESFLNNIYFYGHSLDVTDKDILRDLFEFQYTQIIIFYLDKSDYSQKISNVIKIIGQKGLIKAVHGKNPKIIFKEIEK